MLVEFYFILKVCFYLSVEILTELVMPQQEKLALMRVRAKFDCLALLVFVIFRDIDKLEGVDGVEGCA